MSRDYSSGAANLQLNFYSANGSTIASKTLKVESGGAVGAFGLLDHTYGSARGLTSTSASAFPFDETTQTWQALQVFSCESSSITVSLDHLCNVAPQTQVPRIPSSERSWKQLKAQLILQTGMVIVSPTQ